MRRLAGQAAMSCARWLRRLCGLALALALAFGLGLGALSWRLAQRPLQVNWLVERLQAAANTNGPTRLAIGSAALEWAGFTSGVGEPIAIGVRNATVVDAAGQVLVGVPHGEVTLSLSELLRGRIRPKAIEVDGANISLARTNEGAIALNIGSLSEVADLAAPGEPGQSRERRTAPPVTPPFLADLRHLIVRGGSAAIDDQTLAARWVVSRFDLDATRHASGTVDGHGQFDVALGDVRLAVSAGARAERNGTATDVTLSIEPFVPSHLAAANPRFAPLATIDAPVTTRLRAEVTPEFRFRSIGGTIDVGAGSVHVGATRVEIGSAALAVTADRQAVKAATFNVAFPHPGAPPTRLSGRANGRRVSGGFEAGLVLDLDALPVARLAAVWPEGVGGPGSRPWLVKNLTAGTLRNGHIEASLNVVEDFSDATITSASGALDGDDVTVHWLRPIAPLEHVAGKLSIVDPDTLEIVGQTGRQSGTALTLKGSRVRITGLAGHKQAADIGVQLAGPIADALAVLHEPRLHLFDRHPLDLRDPSGQVAAKIGVKLPLEDKLQMDDIGIQAQGALTDAHLGTIVAGRDLDHGKLDFEAHNDGASINGRAELAGIPALLGVELDFRSGAPDEALQKVTVSGTGDAAQFAAAGLSAADVMTGKVGVQATLTEHRDGHADFIVQNDFKDTGITLVPLGWRKEPGSAASGRLSGRMLHDHITGIDQISLDGEQLRLRGSADFVDGRPRRITVAELAFGETSGHGDIRFPIGGNGPAQPLVVSVAGPMIDLSQRFGSRPKAAASKPTDATSETPWTVDARFDTALVGNGHTFEAVDMHAEASGGIMQRLRLTARTGAKGALTATIAPGADGRRFDADAADAGALLAGLDVVTTIEGGRLTLSGRYDDTIPDRPLSGTAEIANFRVRNAPALGKLLQAVTLYGLVDALSGSGLNFTRLVAPFRYTADAIELYDARAFSASLGLTAKGRVDLAHSEIDMQGTVVPAYALNSALGGIPLIGKLFSAEKGGGLLAISFGLRGPLADPNVSVNPLSALTPGGLRQLFH